MPNHVATNLTLSGFNKKQIEKFIKAITLTKKEQEGGDAKYDFRKLLPVPKELVNTSSSVRIVSEEEYEEAVKRREAEIKIRRNPNLISSLPLTQKMSDEYIKKFGTNNWYDWMLANYGTKWAMYDIASRDEGKFFYMTAWSPATEYFKTVSQQFPDIIFYHEYADEGGGFVGYEEIKNGCMFNSGDFGWESDEGVKIRQRVGYYNDEEEVDDEAENAVI